MTVATHNTMADCRTLRRPATFSHGGLAASIAHTLSVWRTRIRDRQRFAALEQRDLRDLGLSRTDVEHELAKPFWRD